MVSADDVVAIGRATEGAVLAVDRRAADDGEGGGVNGIPPSRRTRTDEAAGRTDDY
jgi:hypothetical protein